uniref:RING-type domain-containing protein n=1 Tax=Zosterops lateralis melanops TaxID=1220523 RepID=A0A8D2NR70_ZOSLA
WHSLWSTSCSPCPICLGEPKDPVCLPCNHVFCHKCISLWLVPAQMHCPYCRVAVEDVELTVSEELRYSSHPLQVQVSTFS